MALKKAMSNRMARVGRIAKARRATAPPTHNPYPPLEKLLDLQKILKRAHLSKRENQALQWLAQDYTQAETARIMGITPNRVGLLIKGIRSKVLRSPEVARKKSTR